MKGSRSLDEGQQCAKGNNTRLQSTSESALSPLVQVSLPNWTLDSNPDDHLWCDTSSSGTMCHSPECHKSGVKKKCSSCHVVCHEKCIDQFQVCCRPTYRESDIRDYRDNGQTRPVLHHWIERRRSHQENQCARCRKSIQTSHPFASKEFVAVQCTWCKSFYHNKSSCFTAELTHEPCSLGHCASIIIPPDWIIKMPRKNTFKSSIRRAQSLFTPISSEPQIIPTSPTRSCENHSTSRTLVHDRFDPIASVSQWSPRLSDELPFVVKPRPTDSAKRRPILVMVNPKSGGNQGLSMLRKFQWILNPRQVFDLSENGPHLGLELFGHIPNLRILACGGDGTVGWVFSTLDQLQIHPSPPVAVLPLGTGNDLARTLHWGPGYTDEPISRILRSVENGEIVSLDRWQVTCVPFSNQLVTPEVADELDDSARSRPVTLSLPLSVFNNYFSLGADAATALNFHESREANPERFNSRLKNKIFYAGRGGKELFSRSWRDLSDHVMLECDGIDMTPVIRSLKPHCILFLNIPRYGSGTMPWGNPPPSTAGFQPARFNDGLLEVIGLSSSTLALLHIGGHGDRICQCRTASLTTTKVVPMQIDGEPCRLAPAQIHIRRSHQAMVIRKSAHAASWFHSVNSLEPDDCEGDLVPLRVFVIPLSDYEALAENALALRKVALPCGQISIPFSSDLVTVRASIMALGNAPDADSGAKLSDAFVFVDSTTAACRFFRIDRNREPLHYITDICNMNEVFLIDPEANVPAPKNQ